MNTDADELNLKRKATARIVCIAAAVFVLFPCLGLRWMRAGGGNDAGISLLFIEAGKQSISNLDAVEKFNASVEEHNARVDRYRSMDRDLATISKQETIMGTFAYAGIATIFFAVIGAGALIAAGVLSFKDKFIRSPIPLTTVALLALCLALITGCVFLGATPKNIGIGGGVGWPFFVFGAGVVAGLAGAQMLAKAYSEVRDPYWDGQV
jgi:hypothetical protein